MATLPIPEKIQLKTIDPKSIDTDIFSIVFKNNKNAEQTTKIVNEIIEYLASYTPPTATVSQADILTAINLLRTTRIIYHDMTDGQTKSYSDNETITRSGNAFIISHPRPTTNVMYKLTELDGTVVDTQISMTSNQIVVTFMYGIDTNLLLHIF